MNFRIQGLPAAPFESLYDLSDVALAARGVRRCRVDRSPGFPCRVSLEDAACGETVLLLNWEHLPLASPYRSRHAIYVREHALPASPAINEVPQSLWRRLLSVRAFDGEGMMVDADVVEGHALEAAIARLLGTPDAAFLHLHNAKPGCYAARVDRA